MGKPHREIWTLANGPIPKDTAGRSYEIHHINGDHNDNRLENLKCVSIEEHFEIHLEQGDFLQAAAVARRMTFPADVMAALNSLGGKQAFAQKKGWFAKSEEEKMQGSIRGGEATRGYRWYNDGVNELRSQTSPGYGWFEGRLANVQRTGKKIGPTPGKEIGVFWNNGERNVRSHECPGEGWMRGKYLTDEQRARRLEIAKLPRQNKSGPKKGTKFGVMYNNGVINKYFKDDPLDGWTKGRLLTDLQRITLSENGKKYGGRTSN